MIKSTDADFLDEILDRMSSRNDRGRQNVREIAARS